MKPPIKLNDEAYVAAKGLKCPFCLSERIDGGSVSIEGGQACQDVACNDCDQEWTDVYDLRGWQQ